jgi:hypothetical protein
VPQACALTTLRWAAHQTGPRAIRALVSPTVDNVPTDRHALAVEGQRTQELWLAASLGRVSGPGSCSIFFGYVARDQGMKFHLWINASPFLGGNRGDILGRLPYEVGVGARVAPTPLAKGDQRVTVHGCHRLPSMRLWIGVLQIWTRLGPLALILSFRLS